MTLLLFFGTCSRDLPDPLSRLGMPSPRMSHYPRNMYNQSASLFIALKGRKIRASGWSSNHIDPAQ